LSSSIERPNIIKYLWIINNKIILQANHGEPIEFYRTVICHLLQPNSLLAIATKEIQNSHPNIISFQLVPTANWKILPFVNESTLTKFPLINLETLEIADFLNLANCQLFTITATPFPRAQPTVKIICSPQ
jgi:hypothetical protein